MSELLIEEQIRMLAKQLKLPTFVTYREQLRQADPSADIGEILLMLMKTEFEQRQENQNLRRLKQAGFPYTKTIFRRTALIGKSIPVWKRPNSLSVNKICPG